MKKVIINVDEKVYDMAVKIRERRGYNSNTQVWIQAMVEFYDRLTKYDYLKIPKKKKPTLTAEDLIAHQSALDNARNKKKEEEKMTIALKLGGTVVEGEDGSKSVRWFNYYSTGKDMQELPLMSLTEDLLRNQFQGNLAKIKKFHNLD